MYQKNYYDILQIPPTCTMEEIKKAYRKLALQFHPDINNQDNNTFNTIKEAYEVLVDAKLRFQYNRTVFGGEIFEKKIDIETIFNDSKKLLQYIQNNDPQTLNYELINHHLTQLLLPYCVGILQFNKDTLRANEIEKNMVSIIEVLPYEQFNLIVGCFTNAFPLQRNYVDKLLKEKKNTMLWEKYSVIFAFLVAIGLCIFIALIS